MSKRKRYGVSNAVARGLSETITIAEHSQGLFRNAIIPLDRIELDPENPRKLLITRSDLPKGPDKNDPSFQLKITEFESLKGLAKTIETKGLIQPVAVYKHDENYRVVAGNRRCLASILAGKKEVEARIFNEKPKRFELKLIQLIENTAREDLSFIERLDNIQDINNEYEQDTKLEMTPEMLNAITGFSLTVSRNYLYVLSAPEDVKTAIKEGAIQNLDKAALIANISTHELREKTVAACKKGISIQGLRTLISNEKELSRLLRNEKKSTSKGRGRAAAKVHMGTTPKTSVVKVIIDAVLKQKEYSHLSGFFNRIDWHHYKETTEAFKKLINLLEKSCLE